MTYRLTRIVVLCAYAAAASTLAIAWPSAPAGVGVFSLPLILVVPGYVLASAVRPLRDLPASEFWPVAVGTSIALDVLAGLGLNELPSGLTATSWTLALFVFTAAGCVFTAAGGGRRTGRPRLRRLTGGAVGVVVAAGALVAAGAITISTARRTPAEPTTTLSFGALTGGGSARTARVDVLNREGGTVSYRLRVVPARGPARTVVHRVVDGARWSLRVRVLAAAGRVRVDLFCGGSRIVYRTIWLDPARTASIAAGAPG